MFDILLTEELVREPVSEGPPDAQAVYGKVRIGDYQDTFIASLFFWSRERYEQHWRTALQQVVDGAGKSALITSYVEPPAIMTSDDFLVWWPLYREGDIVYVQNQLLFFEQLGCPFSTAQPWESVSERRIVNEDGLQVSEWATDIRSIQACLNRLMKT